jgi:OOP family OmpA-OmpF porin
MRPPGILSYTLPMQIQLNIFPARLVLLALFIALLSQPVIAQGLATANAALERAMAADAESLAPKTFASAQKLLNRATQLQAQNRSTSQITAAFRDTTDEFDRAELEAIMTTVLGPARLAIKDAEKLRAKRYAPVTLAQARELLAAAETQLIDDRYTLDKAEQLVNQAEVTARHAGQIAALIRTKPKMETFILQWEGYLSRIQSAAGVSIPLDTETAAGVEQLETVVRVQNETSQQLQLELADSQAFIAALETEIRELDDQLGGASQERHQLILQIEDRARKEEQFAQTEALFETSEASVFRQSKTIVVRLYGLAFAPGSDELGEENAALLDKISKAISVYPKSTLIVEGHTDSQGSAKMNQRLSKRRADALLNHLVTTENILPQRISAVGYGASNPIANNNSAEGRAKNRRIELMITPGS